MHEKVIIFCANSKTKKHATYKKQNSKSEFQNSKQIQKTKIQMIETNSIRGQCLEGISLEHWYI